MTDDLEGLRFNTAISRLMEFVNAFTAQEVRPKAAMETFTLLLAPLAPAPRRRALADPRPRADAGLRALADLRPGAAEGRRDRVPGPGQRQAPRRGSSSPPDADRRRDRGRRARPTSEIAALLDGKTIGKVDHRAGQAGELRGELNQRRKPAGCELRP